MKINIRQSATLVASIAILGAMLAGPAEARGGARELHLERAERAQTRTLSSRPADATDRQKADVKTAPTSDADPGGWLGLDWPDFEQPSDRPFPRRGIPHGR